MSVVEQADSPADDDKNSAAVPVGKRKQEIRRRLERLIGIAATEGNELRVLRNGDEIFPAMLGAIRAAEHTVDMMTFVYWRGDIARDFAAALSERAREGVRVRLLLDGFGSSPIQQDLLDEMSSAGVHVVWFRKPLWVSPLKQNHRCHRKALVVDERTAFTGGVGIAEEWCGDARHPGEWRDTHIQVRGPAVDGITAAFAQNWAECHQELFDEKDRFIEHDTTGRSVVQVVRGSASFGWQDMQTLLRVLLESARERVRVSTAYFTPDDFFVQLLCRTARRGVTIDILIPGPHTDKRVSQLGGRRSYEDLLDAGVRIAEYQPTMLHAKIVTIDGIVSLVGSTNFNRRSLEHDEEVMLAVVDEELTATLDKHFAEDWEGGDLITPGRWKRRPVQQRLGEAAVRPIRRFL
ncbi:MULTISPECIES: phospholipase D-like domain-containing protein [Streptomyces]|uniref:Cardiolipin synthase B n=1 Tax=Streptomyces reniochalinae TaxID=2250578 RepID=A0A367ECP9_9ACTN|nr:MULTISPECIES: phospholipase D-like domain-containing protein [Streptomyces]RCG15137.1 cardiolipin synthase B [Streptomyces reniochalinae]